MISAAVLGIALVSLVQMHTTSIQSTSNAENLGRATEIARQIADSVASQPLTQITCGDAAVALPPGPQGCRASAGPGRAPAGDKSGAAGCTTYYATDGLNDAVSGAPNILPSETETSFRVDERLARHPNNAPGAAQLHVWVCWRGRNGMYNEIHTTRTKVEGIW